jgi:hypothetical protein
MGCSNLAGTDYSFLRGSLGFLSTPDAEPLKLTGAHTSSAAASSGTFLLVLLLTLRAGSYIGSPACGWLWQREALVYSLPLAGPLEGR